MHTIQFYKYIQYHVSLRHVPTWLLHPLLLIAVTNDFNFVCLHIISRTIEVTTNEIIAVTNRKTSIV